MYLDFFFRYLPILKKKKPHFSSEQVFGAGGAHQRSSQFLAKLRPPWNIGEESDFICIVFSSKIPHRSNLLSFPFSSIFLQYQMFLQETLSIIFCSAWVVESLILGPKKVCLISFTDLLSSIHLLTFFFS